MKSMRENNEEDEVDFHPRYNSIGTSNDESEDNGVSVTSSRSARSIDIVASRVVGLEGDLDEVKNQVTSIDAKLDLLISSAAFNAPAATSTPPRSGRGNGRPSYRPLTADITLPPPRDLTRRENGHGYVDEMMHREKFSYAQTDGKSHPLEPLPGVDMPKPYMYVDREGISTNKQLLEIRNSVTMPEYVYATIALVRDSRGCHPDDRDHILAHLQDVAVDAITRPWESVRRWSHFIWDQVEKGRMAWGDNQNIQNHRLRMATIPRGSTQPESRSHARKECICRSFNSRAGCRFRTHHEEGQVRLMHLCAFCDSVGRQCTGHNVIACDNKLRQAPQWPHIPPPMPTQNNNAMRPLEQNWRANTNQQFQYFQQPKNGQ